MQKATSLIRRTNRIVLQSLSAKVINIYRSHTTIKCLINITQAAYIPIDDTEILKSKLKNLQFLMWNVFLLNQ